MGQQPPKSDLGAANSRRKRSARARERDERIWAAIEHVAAVDQPRTLQGYADIFNEAGFPTASEAGPWSAGLVQRTMKAHGETAKSMWARYNREKSPGSWLDYPVDVFNEYRSLVLKYATTTTENGACKRAIEHPVQTGNTVWHRSYGYGSVSEVLAIPMFQCRFMGDDGHFVWHDVPAAELSVWVPVRTAEETRLLLAAEWNRLIEGREKVMHARNPYLPPGWEESGFKQE